MNTPTHPSPVEPFAVRRFWTGLLCLCGVILGAFVLFTRWLDSSVPRHSLPVIAEVTGDVSATERSGRTVRVSDLKGKVIACAYLYTVCPHGCAAVVTQMQRLHKDFGQRLDFHQLSIAVVPERDTPITLNAYAEAIGVKPEDHWWFVTGPRDPLVNFMTADLKLQPCRFIPPEQRLNPADMFEHDLRIVLIDRHSRIRGYYSVFHEDPSVASLMCEKLHKDTITLLNEP